MVDVTHDGDDWRTWGLGLGRFFALQIFFDLVALEHLRNVAHLFDHERRGVAIDRLVDGGHHAHVEHGLDDFGGLHGHLLRDFLRRDGLADGDFTLDRRGGHLERMTRFDAYAAAAGAFLDSLLFLAARAGAAGDVQLLAAVARVLGGIHGDDRRFFRLVSLGSCRRSCHFGGSTALRLGLLACALLFQPTGFFRLLFLGRFVFDTAAVLRLHALAFLARGFLALALGGFRRFLFLALFVDCTLRLLVLLFENVALDIGFLVANFDVHRACAPLRARLLELALRFACERDLARRGGTGGLAGLGGAVRAAQMREQLELGLVADQRLGAGDLDSRRLELHEQPVDRNLQDFSKLCNGDIGHKFPQARPASNQISRAFMMSLPASSDVSPSISSRSSTAWSARSSRVRTPRRASARARSGFMPSSSSRSSAGMPESSVSSLAMACVSNTSRARLRSSLTISSSNSSMLASSDCGR